MVILSQVLRLNEIRSLIIHVCGLRLVTTLTGSRSMAGLAMIGLHDDLG